MNALSHVSRQAAPALRSSSRQASTLTVLHSTSSATALPLSNVEVQWEKLSRDEQLDIHRKLEALQKKDWKSLTMDEKKAGQSLRSACANLVATDVWGRRRQPLLES